MTSAGWAPEPIYTWWWR